MSARTYIRPFSITWSPPVRVSSRLNHHKVSCICCSGAVSWRASSEWHDSARLHQKLMANSGATLQITSAGFQFLLHPPHEQLWELLLQYLQMAEVKPFSLCAYGMLSALCPQERQMDLVEVLSFLLMLSTTELGKVCCPLNCTSAAAVNHEFSAVGLLHREPKCHSKGDARRPPGLWTDQAADSQ